MSGNIYPVFLHRGNGLGIYAMGFYAGTVDLGVFTGKEPKVAFCYLATTAVTGT
jgi:hypothetical protein